MSGYTVWADVKFRKTNEGGLKGSFCPYDFFTGEQHQLGYLMHIDGKYFDFRFFQAPCFVELGQTYRLLVKFLVPSLVLPRLSVGKKFSVWRSRTIADGEIVEISDSEPVMSQQLKPKTPDFYLLTIGADGSPQRELQACFLTCLCCPHDLDCYLRVYAQDVADAENGVSCHAQEKGLYCPVDILSNGSIWPQRVVEVSSIKLGGGNYDLSLHEEGVLFKDKNSAIDFKDNMAAQSLEHLDRPSVLNRTKAIFDELDLYYMMSQD